MSTTIILAVFFAGVAYVIYTLFLRTRLVVWKVNRIRRELRNNAFEDITKQGFTFYDKQVLTDYKWRDVESIEFVTPKTVKVSLKNKSSFSTLPTCVGYIEFIKKVPNGIAKFDYQYVTNYFANLKPCKICGLNAVDEGTCLNCLSKESDAANRKDDLEAYYKEEQLDYFTTDFDNNESVETTLRKARQNELFSRDSNWKIYPTNQEIADAKKEWAD